MNALFTLVVLRQAGQWDTSSTISEKVKKLVGGSHVTWGTGIHGNIFSELIKSEWERHFEWLWNQDRACSFAPCPCRISELNTQQEIKTQDTREKRSVSISLTISPSHHTNSRPAFRRRRTRRSSTNRIDKSSSTLLFRTSYRLLINTGPYFHHFEKCFHHRKPTQNLLERQFIEMKPPRRMIFPFLAKAIIRK